MFEMHNLVFKDILNIADLKIDAPVTCITGPSGCGKTTLLKMFNRMNAPTRGSIFYRGEDIFQMNPVFLRRQIIMMGQAPILYSGTVKDNLLAGIRFSEKKEPSEDILKNALKNVRLDISLEDSCVVLSGGEKQRLCLARVILMNGDVYLLDEPSSALDKETEEFLVTHLAEFTRAAKKQLIMVTHSENAVKACNPVVIQMEHGQVKRIKEASV